MGGNSERDDWIKELTETRDQLGRLSNQLENIQGQDFKGMIGRIQHLQIRLDMISKWLEGFKS